MTVEVRTDDPGGRFAVGAVFRADKPMGADLTVASARWHAGHLLVAFAGIGDRDAAEALRGSWLTVDAADIPASTDPDEFHDQQLVGLTVITVEGGCVGTVSDVLHHGQDLLVVTPASGAAGQELLIPFVKAIAVHVDVREGRIVIDPPGGLLELSTGARGEGGPEQPGSVPGRAGDAARAASAGTADLRHADAGRADRVPGRDRR